jgi:hypothetical protein
MFIENLFLIVSILIIWFNTEAFVEYSRLLHLPLVKVKEYLFAKKRDCTLSYHTFLLINYNNFFTRLITCPICTSVWLSIIVGIFTQLLFIYYPMLFICSLYLYELYNKLTGYENK